MTKLEKLYSIIGFAEDAHAQQNWNKFHSAFAYKDKSYTCLIDNADIVYWDVDENYKVHYSEFEDDVDYIDCLIEYALGEEVKEE